MISIIPPGQAYETHLFIGFLLMIVFGLLYSRGVMSATAALILGLISIFTVACGWEIYGNFFTGEKIDVFDIFYSVMGSIFPAVGVTFHSIEVKHIHHPSRPTSPKHLHLVA